MKTLKDVIEAGIEESNQIAIYAVTPFTPESEARIGQTQFDNGGLLDDKEFVVNGEALNRHVEIFFSNVGGLISDSREMDAAMAEWIAEELIPELETDRQARKDWRI